MKVRPAFRTAAACALLLLALFLGARAVGHELASPFDGFERLSRAPKTPTADPEIKFVEAARKVDWDAPPPAVVPPRSMPKSAAKPALLTDLTLKPVVRLEAGEALRLVSWQAVHVREIAVDLSSYFVVSGDPNIDDLAKSLKLSDSQKARIAELMEWRRWSLDSLTGAEKADAAKVKKIEDGYHEAVKLELDQVQARDYEKLATGRGRLVELTGDALVTLTQRKDTTQSRSVSEWLKAQAQK